MWHIAHCCRILFTPARMPKGTTSCRGVRTAAWLRKHNQSLRIFHLLSSNILLHNLILCKLILQTRSPVTGPYAIALQRPRCICSKSRSQDFEMGTSISTNHKMTFDFQKIETWMENSQEREQNPPHFTPYLFVILVVFSLQLWLIAVSFSLSTDYDYDLFTEMG